MNPSPQENSDLLAGKSRVERNGNTRHDASTDDVVPPDGGFRAYAILVGAFMTNGLLFGQINSYSVLYPVIKKQLENDGVLNADSRAALVGSLAMGTLFLLSPVSGVLTGIMGLRLTAVVGGIIATTGLIISSFVTHNVDALMFTYGIMFGLGASLSYTPSLAILGHYFRKHLGQVNGVVALGSSVFTVFMPPLMDHMIVNYGLNRLFQVLAVFTFGVALCGLLFKPLTKTSKRSRKDNSAKSYLRSIINIEIWRNRRYKFWALSMPIALFGYFVPYVHIKKLLEDTFVDINFNLPLQCIAFTSGFGRLLFGYLADRPGIDRIILQQISFYVIGALTIIIPFVKVFWLLIIISLGMGIFDGAFVALIGPIAFELCGGVFAPQAIGCMLGLAAFPLTIGPSIAGSIYSSTNSYTLPFVLAGFTPIIGASLMFAVRIRGLGVDPKANANLSLSPNAEKSPAP